LAKERAKVRDKLCCDKMVMAVGKDSVEQTQKFIKQKVGVNGKREEKISSP